MNGKHLSSVTDTLTLYKNVINIVITISNNILSDDNYLNIKHTLIKSVNKMSITYVVRLYTHSKQFCIILTLISYR